MICRMYSDVCRGISPPHSGRTSVESGWSKRLVTNTAMNPRTTDAFTRVGHTSRSALGLQTTQARDDDDLHPEQRGLENREVEVGGRGEGAEGLL